MSSSVPPSPVERRLDGALAIAAASLEIGSAVQDPVGDEVDGNGKGGNRRGGDQCCWNAEDDAVLVLLDHAAPIGLRRLHAETEERKRRKEEHGEDETQAEFGNQGRQRVGKDL